MNISFDPARDLKIARVIKAPRSAVWAAWTDPASFAQWWVPAPARCKVVDMDVRPGGGLVTRMSENGGEFVPHLTACFLDIENGHRIVFTTALGGGWRPAEESLLTITAIITLSDSPIGTDYTAHVMHKSPADSKRHEDLGFYDGWGTVAAQLAAFVERKSQE